MKILSNFLEKHHDRVVGLDILRSIAILLVVYYHGRFILPPHFRSLYDNIQILNIDGVSIFFVLSGFLIGGILLKIINKTDFKKVDLINFWIRRWFRTIPNYYFILIILLILRFVTRNDIGDFNWKYFIFFQNFLYPHPNFFPEAWSLAVEEWFYILFPLMCYIFLKLLKKKTKSIFVSAIIFIIIPLIIRILKFNNGLVSIDIDSEIRKIVVYRLDCIMYGVIGAYIAFKHPNFWYKSRFSFLILGIILLIALYFNILNLKYIYFPLIFNVESIATFCFLPFLCCYKSTNNKILDSFFIFISIISYSMYLLNLTPVQRVLIPTFNNLFKQTNFFSYNIFLINYLFYWLFTIIGSYILYTFYEYPVTKLRDKIHF